jgi:carotenoid cleavage dioxygenase-like enzyme
MCITRFTPLSTPRTRQPRKKERRFRLIMVAMASLLVFALVAALTPTIASLSITAGANERALRNAHLQGRNNEIMNDLFKPVATEVRSAKAAFVRGGLPSDFPRGAVLKNGPNARYDSAGGWLDGDGMVHCVVLPPDASEPRYSRTYLRTCGFSKEEAAGEGLFLGSLVAPDGYRLLWALFKNAVRAAQPQKDTANTAFLRLRGTGRVLALMEQCLPCEFTVATDATLTTTRASCDFDGIMLDRQRFPFSGGATTAHFKVDCHGLPRMTWIAMD